MKIKIDDQNWKDVILFDPPSRTVTINDGSVWHISKNRNEILELDIYMTSIIEKHAPWEIEDRKTLALTRGKQSFSSYRIEIEDGDGSKYEMFYFYKFLYDKAEYLRFPEDLLEGECVEVQSAAVRYFLADTLFFDFLISKSSSEENVSEVHRNMTAMKKKWIEI